MQSALKNPFVFTGFKASQRLTWWQVLQINHPANVGASIPEMSFSLILSYLIYQAALWPFLITNCRENENSYGETIGIVSRICCKPKKKQQQ